MEEMLKELKKEKIDSGCLTVPCCIDPRIVRKGCHYYKHIIWAWRGTGNGFCVRSRTLLHHQKYLVDLVVSLQDDALPATFLHNGFIWESGEETAITAPGEDCKVCSVLLSSETQ